MRKTVLDYDDVMNLQREVIYGERKRALFGENLRESVLGMMDQAAANIVGQFHSPDPSELGPLDDVLNLYFEKNKPTVDELSGLSAEAASSLIAERMKSNYQDRIETMGDDVLAQIERIAILRVVDEKWMDHLDAMTQLRQGVGLQAYGHNDPLVEYKKEAFDMFQEMTADIQNNVVRLCLRAQLISPLKQREGTTENRSDGEPAKKQPVKKTAAQRVGRNDPCPCGSGKKYKNCCGKNAE